MRRKNPFIGRTAFTSRGASFVEILVALVIILISALAAGSFFSNQMSLTRNMTKVSSCRAALDSQLSYLRQMGSAGGSFEWDGRGSAAGPTVGASRNAETVTTGLDDPWMKATVRNQAMLSTDLLKDNGAGPHQLNAHLLSRGAMGTVSALYNNVPGICTGIDISTLAKDPSQQNPADIDLDLLKNFKSTIQIEPYDLVSGAADTSCPNPMWARPQGYMDAQMATNKVVSFSPDVSAKIGYRVKLKGTYEDISGASKTCAASEDFAYPIDRQKQKISVVLNASDVSTDSISPAMAVTPYRDRPECTQDATARFGAKLKLDVGFSALPSIGTSGNGRIDPGTVFLCADRSVQINPDFCHGAAGAAMDGSPQTAAMAAANPWVPCNEVKACGLAPASVVYARSGPGEIKYTLNYDNSTAPAGHPDGLWGCDIQIDVATVDAAGNFELLSSHAHPNPTWAALGLKATGGKYFQPTKNCYACYKKKPFSFLAIIAIVAVGALTGGVGALAAGIALAATAAGVAAACASGLGGACRVGGAKFLHNSCYAEFPPTGKKFCKVRKPRYPAWFIPPGQTEITPIPCKELKDQPYPYPENNKTYSFPASDDQAVKDDLWIDTAAGRYCEAQAVCESGTWKPVTEPGDPPNPPMASCGNFKTEKNLNSDGSVTSRCTLMIPDNYAGVMHDRNYYFGFPNLCNGTQRCKISGSHTYYPTDGRDNSVINHGPDYLFYEPYVHSNDASLPGCT